MGHKLKNAPLIEAMFEVFWELPLDETGFPTDPEFDLALGKFASTIEGFFPVHKKLFPDTFKVAQKPSHQFWKGELAWPVVQIGPGIMAYNDTDKNYDWEGNFRPGIHKAIEVLQNSYSEKPVFKKVTLRYIDSVDVGETEFDIKDFVAKNFNSSLVTNYSQPGRLKGLNINQVFELKDGSSMSLNIQTAINNSNRKPAIVWITAVEKNEKLSALEILSWLDEVHSLCSSNFKEMLNPEFYARFD